MSPGGPFPTVAGRRRFGPCAPRQIPSPAGSPGGASFSRQAFSLIELLVVMVVVGILMVLMVPAIQGITGGANITRVSEEIAASVNLARQRASTFNRQVAIRFYEGQDGFDAYQIWEKPEAASDPDAPDSWKPVAGKQKLPAGVLVKKGTAHSALLERFSGNTEPGPNGNVNYSAVLFTPAGSLVAANDEAFLTVVPTRGIQSGGVVPDLPPNFATVVIEPFNARPTVYRP